MEDRQQRRKARKIEQQRQAAGCFGLIAVTVLLLAGILILWVLEGPAFSGWTTRLGLDVSEYQEDIDWETVHAAGFDFAFVRIGYRGYSVGEIFADDWARENLEGARAAGLDVGVYFYSQAISPEEAAEEARWCLNFLAGESLDLPVVYDWEWVGPEARTGGMDKASLTECAQIFCTAIEAAGYQPMIYFNSHVGRDLLDLEALSQYPFWLAQYKEQMNYPHQVDFWQYTETGTVPGIEGDVDIDLMFIYE